MAEEQPVGDKEFQDFVTRVNQTEHRYYQEVTIAKVLGPCPYGHKEGDTYRVTNCNSDGLCGALYAAIHPSIVTLHYGGSLPWEKDADAYRRVCPEMNVEVSVRRFEKGDFNMFRTESPLKDMTGKGFPAIDKYRAFIEVLDVEHNCAWGHEKGHRFEVDPFNVGKACGFLYGGIYQFLNLYFAGVDLPWEMEERAMCSACPDTYNVVSFRLVMEER